MEKLLLYASYIIFILVNIKSLHTLICQNKVIIRGSSTKKRWIFPVIVLVSILNALALGTIHIPLLGLQILFFLTLIFITEGIKGDGIVSQDKTTIRWDKITSYVILERESYLKITFYTKYLNKRYRDISLHFKLEDKENMIKLLDANILS